MPEALVQSHVNDPKGVDPEISNDPSYYLCLGMYLLAYEASVLQIELTVFFQFLEPEDDDVVRHIVRLRSKRGWPTILPGHQQQKRTKSYSDHPQVCHV